RGRDDRHLDGRHEHGEHHATDDDRPARLRGVDRHHGGDGCDDGIGSNRAPRAATAATVAEAANTGAGPKCCSSAPPAALPAPSPATIDVLAQVNASVA